MTIEFTKIVQNEPVIQDIGGRFHSAIGPGKLQNIIRQTYGLHEGKKVIISSINESWVQFDDGDDLLQIMRWETLNEYSFIPNGRKKEIRTLYQRIALPGQSENALDGIPDTITKKITRVFKYEQINNADKYRHRLSQIHTQEDVLCVVSGKDVDGNPRDPYPIALQQSGISYKVAEGNQIEFIEAFKVHTETFENDEVTHAVLEKHTGTNTIETSTLNVPPVEVNLSTPCRPPGKIVKVVKGNKAGKTLKLENPNIIHTSEAEQMAEEILVVNSWTKQITRSKTYLGIIPIHIINQRAGNIGYTISVNHQEPSATTKIVHVEMIEDSGDEESEGGDE